MKNSSKAESKRYAERFRAKPGHRVRLKDIDPDFTGKGEDKKSAERTIEKLEKRMEDLQSQLYAEGKRSLLICLQALDAGGKDGVVRHVLGTMNAQSCRVVSFKQPSSEELAHDFLWRIEAQTPRRGEVRVFNRSHYEDVLIVRVHDLVPKQIWSRRYEQINDFERRLSANNTRIIKFFLHISKDEQLERFRQRLYDPAKNWKISESDYSERQYWDQYQTAYEDAINKCTTDEAPWYVIPANHKWFRNLVISQIIVETLEGMDIQRPEPMVNIEEIRKKYHEALAQNQKRK